MKRLNIVFDLDGTLANTAHRAHFMEGPKKDRDWRAFYAACDQDTAHIHVLSVLWSLRRDGHHIEIWSGRSDEVRDKTVRWLLNCGLSGIPLRMREAGDYTPDDILKRRWLDEAVWKPDLIFDDRAKVVAMWREAGIPCFQVAPGDF